MSGVLSGKIKGFHGHRRGYSDRSATQSAVGYGAMNPIDPNTPAEPRRERRRYLRIKVAVDVRLELEKQATPLRAHTSDLSLGGCYVEMMFTLEVGTKVKLTLFVSDGKVTVDGIVATRDLQVGNGIRFTAMAPEDNARLRHFIAIVR